jgi:hypothetical protein
MKKLSIIAFLFFLTSFLYAQMDPGYFLSRIPSIPSDACMKITGGDQRKNFHENIAKLSHDLTEEIATREKTIETEVKNSKDQIRQEKAKEIGLSDADAQKMNGQKLSKEEKKAMIDKVLKDQNYSSLRNTKTEAGKQAWAKNFSTQQQANLMSKMNNPDSIKSEEQLKMEKNLEKNKNVNDLAQEQQLIINKIFATDKKFSNQMTDINKKDSVATIVYKNAIKPLNDRLIANPPPDMDEMIRIKIQIQDEGRIYCSKLTPDFCRILKDSYSALTSFTLDYRKLDEVSAKLNKETIGVNKDFSSPGLSHLKAISQYVNWLGQVYKYEKGDLQLNIEESYK